MHDSLYSTSALPELEPYTSLGYQFTGGGGELFDQQAWAGYPSAVDWVIVELRDAHEPARVVSSRCGIISNIGSVRNPDFSPLSFCVPIDDYHVALRHRNHLAVMTMSPVRVDGGFAYADFTTPANVRGGTLAMKPLGPDSALWGLWPGNVNFDDAVIYTGDGNDRDPILVAIGGNTPSNTIQGTYAQEDVNMDNKVKYVGEDNDRDVILVSVGGNTPHHVRRDFLPKDTLVLRERVYVMDDLPLLLDTLASDIVSNTVMRYAVAGQIPDIQPGDIIIGNDPRGGYLRRVTSVSAPNDSLVVQTEQGKLTDVFASGTMSLAISNGNSPSFGRNLYYIAPFILFNTQLFTVSIEDISLSYDGISVCEMTFGPFGITSGEFSHRQVQLALNYKLKFEGTLLEDEVTFAPLEATLGEGLIMIGPVPIYYQLEFSTPITATFAINTALNTSTTIGATLNADIGVKYENGGFQDINTAHFLDPIFNSEVTSLSGSAEASLSWAPEVQLKLYKAGGPYFSSGPVGSMAFNANVTETGLDHSVDGDIRFETRAGVKVDVLGFEADYAFVYESEPIAEYKGPSRIDTASTQGNLQIGSPEEPLPEPLRVRVLSALTLPGSDSLEFASTLVPVNFQVISGGGSLSEHRVYTDSDGWASTEWTLGIAPLHEQRVRAWVRNGEGDTIPSSVLFTVDSSYQVLQAISAISQAGQDNTPLMQDIRVRVLEQPSGEPVAGQDVRFEIISGGGWLTEANATTDATGEAATSWSLPTETPTPQLMRAFVLSQTGDTIPPGPINFTAEYGAPFITAVFSGGSNSGTAGSTKWIEVDLGRSWGADPQSLTSSPLGGRLIQFQCNLPDGSVTSQGSVNTAPDGTAQFPFTLPAVHGEGSITALHVNTMGDTVFTSLPYYVCDACPATVTDIDGNSYPVVNIGCKCWMAKNLETTKFKNGDPIPQGTNIPLNANDTIWGAFNDRLGPLNAPARGAKHFVASNVSTYGWLYNGWVIDDARGVCPAGWKVPSGADFEQLIAAAGGDSLSGPALRSNTGLWNIPPADSAPWAAQPHRDTYGFNLLPGGSIPHWCCPNTNPCCVQTEEEFLQEIAGEDTYLWSSDRGYAELGYTYSYMDLSWTAVSLSSGTANSCRCVLGE